MTRTYDVIIPKGCVEFTAGDWLKYRFIPSAILDFVMYGQITVHPHVKQVLVEVVVVVAVVMVIVEVAVIIITVVVVVVIVAVVVVIIIAV
ncbi:hypothetical protein ElyMa_001024500 [Elysia marginata]|uniref:Uncharacterized protein n=1 Tax=Elysia marginata TaxID=1093978 RepID=A0AAV4HLS7_9GAST|nr:hypothetical protein ElyMa_001024500 [Elysia marginata]